ncbi:MAG TPA: hypothetical protein VMI54_18350, partial [Polyangiaceae bacterium]|nr:hypothetical protein [Polyangiaceae bacterium]
MVGRRWLSGVALAAVCAEPAVALAEPPAATSASGAPNESSTSAPAQKPSTRQAVEPPVALATPIEYPADQTTSATVVLELEVDVNGNV